jgi:hypothetical protein
MTATFRRIGEMDGLADHAQGRLVVVLEDAQDGAVMFVEFVQRASGC